jgi:hypothetical protein
MRMKVRHGYGRIAFSNLQANENSIPYPPAPDESASNGALPDLLAKELEGFVEFFR